MALTRDRWHPSAREREQRDHARHSPDSAASDDSDRPRSRTRHSYRHTPSPARDRSNGRHHRGSSAGSRTSATRHSHTPAVPLAAVAAAAPPNGAVRPAEWLGPAYLLSPTQDVRLLRSHAPMAAIAHAAPHTHPHAQVPGRGPGAGITFGPPMAGASHANGAVHGARRGGGPPMQSRTLNSTVDAQTSPHVRKLFEAGAEAIALDDHAAAMPVFSAILKVPHLTTQNQYDAFNRRAWCFERLGQLEEALQDLTAAIDAKVKVNKPEDATASYMARGRVALKLGRNPQSALDDFTACLKFNTNYYLAYQQRATAYHTLGRLCEELADLTVMARLRPNEWRSLYQRGQCLVDMKEYEKAIEDYGAVLRLNPQHKRVRFLRAIAYHRLKRYDRALSEYSAAIEKTPDNADAYYNRGLIREKIADTQPGGRANALNLALNDFRKATELYADPKDVEDSKERIAAVEQRLRAGAGSGGGATDGIANGKSDAEPKAKSQTDRSPSPAPADREAAHRKRKTADASPNGATKLDGASGSESAKKLKSDARGDVKALSPQLSATAAPQVPVAPQRPPAAAAAAVACSGGPADATARLTAVEAEVRRMATELAALAAAHAALQRQFEPLSAAASVAVRVKREPTNGLVDDAAD